MPNASRRHVTLSITTSRQLPASLARHSRLQPKCAFHSSSDRNAVQFGLPHSLKPHYVSGSWGTSADWKLVPSNSPARRATGDVGAGACITLHTPPLSSQSQLVREKRGASAFDCVSPCHPNQSLACTLSGQGCVAAPKSSIPAGPCKRNAPQPLRLFLCSNFGFCAETLPSSAPFILWSFSITDTAHERPESSPV